jgi:hypothetical protein
VGSSTTSVGLIGFHTENPSGYAWAVFPFAARFHEYGRHDTWATPLFVHSDVVSTHSTVTWVFPSIHVETSPTRTLANVYPFFWHAHGAGWNHTVLAPLFAEVNSESRAQHILLTPFYATVRGRTSTYNWAFPNVLWWEENHLGERSWGWDVAPFVQYGRPHPSDEYWSVFYGLVGFRRQGSYQQGRLFWIPFGMGGTPPTSEGDGGGGGSSPAPGSAGGGAEHARGGGNGDVRIEM